MVDHHSEHLNRSNWGKTTPSLLQFSVHFSGIDGWVQLGVIHIHPGWFGAGLVEECWVGMQLLGNRRPQISPSWCWHPCASSLHMAAFLCRQQVSWELSCLWPFLDISCSKIYLGWVWLASMVLEDGSCFWRLWWYYRVTCSWLFFHYLMLRVLQ